MFKTNEEVMLTDQEIPFEIQFFNPCDINERYNIDIPEYNLWVNVLKL